MSAPTMRRLRNQFGPKIAKTVRGLCTGDIDPDTYCADYIRQCGHYPREAERTMEAINIVLEGYGVEGINGQWLDNYYCDIIATYVNMGDTYDATILFDHATGNYRLTSFGDYVEARNL